jgi:glycosyltransferase involved in cell wall biosynthesis
MLIEDKDLKISVIIPVYNAERYLNRCIEAVLAQTHKDLEIILINDGSTDASGEIIHSFKDERIIMIEKKNGGVSAARNDGLKKA